MVNHKNFKVQTKYILTHYEVLPMNKLWSTNVWLNGHSFMKHGFFSLKQFLSHITKFPPGFSSSGIFPFTGIFSIFVKIGIVKIGMAKFGIVKISIGNQWWPRLRLSPSLVPLGGEQYHSSLRLKGTMTHSFPS